MARAKHVVLSTPPLNSTTAFCFEPYYLLLTITTASSVDEAVLTFTKNFIDQLPILLGSDQSQRFVGESLLLEFCRQDV